MPTLEVIPIPHRLPLERRAAWLLGVPTLLVFVAFAVAQALVTLTGRNQSLISTFGPDGEHNVPSFWNTVLLLSIAGVCLLLAVLTRAGRRPTSRVWVMAALALTYLAMDEALSLHEQLGGPVDALAESLGTSVPTYAWVLPGAVLVVVGAVLATRSFAAVPRDVRIGLGIAGATYVTGALVVETLNGALFKAGMTTLYAASTGVEELLEMGACVIAVCVLLRMVDVDPVTRTTTLRTARPLGSVADDAPAQPRSTSVGA